MLRCFSFGVLLASLPLLAGCSGSDKTSGRVAVTGGVSLKGVPLSEGLIQFEPLEKQNTSASVPLVGGNFSISAANGLQPGMYRVRVSISQGESKPIDPSVPLTPSGNKTDTKKPTVPPEWSGKSKQQVEVKAEGANKFDFDIK